MTFKRNILIDYQNDWLEKSIPIEHKLLSEVIDNVSPAACKVWLWLLSRTNFNNEYKFCDGEARSGLNMSLSSIRRALADLEKTDLITRRMRKSKGYHTGCLNKRFVCCASKRGVMDVEEAGRIAQMLNATTQCVLDANYELR